MKDLLGQPIRVGQRCVHINEDNFSSPARLGTVVELTEKYYVLRFDKAPGNVRGSKMYAGAPVLANIDGIVDKYPENFL
jgi:hypothetical protein